MAVRLVVTGHRNGQSTFISDEMEIGYAFKAVPGMVQNSLWATEPPPTLSSVSAADAVLSLVPSDGGTRLSVIAIAPDSVYHSPTFDPGAAGQEFGENLPGLVERFEPDNPGMHRTPTVDYIIVLSGAVVLELDNGETRSLKAHDIVVQDGTRHAWRNPFDTPATLAVVMIGRQAK